jgi:hypothetical protein
MLSLYLCLDFPGGLGRMLKFCIMSTVAFGLDPMRTSTTTVRTLLPQDRYRGTVLTTRPRLTFSLCSVSCKLYEVNAFADGFQRDLTDEMHSSLSYCFYDSQPFFILCCLSHWLRLDWYWLGLKLILIAHGITDRSSWSFCPFFNLVFQLVGAFYRPYGQGQVLLP